MIQLNHSLAFLLRLMSNANITYALMDMTKKRTNTVTDQEELPLTASSH